MAGTVASLAKALYTQVDGAKLQQRQCGVFKERVQRAERLVAKAKPNADVQSSVKDVERIIKQAIDFIKESEQRGWFKRLAKLGKSKNDLAELGKQLEETMSELDTEAGLGMAERQKEMQAAAQEDHRAIQELLKRVEAAQDRGELDASKAAQLAEGLGFDPEFLQVEITDHLECGPIGWGLGRWTNTLAA